MRKNLIYAGMLLLGLTVATSCSNEEGLEQILSNGTTIEAVIENAAEARTSVNDNYEVLWTTGDAFNVFKDGEKKATLRLSEGYGTTSGKFTIDNSDVTITEDMVALFPASETLSYEFKTTYNSQETDAPMSATFADGKFTFSLLTAMVRVVITDVPQGTAVLTISSNDMNLTGEATLSNGALGLVANGGTKEVTVTIQNNTASTLTFDVPVPVQNYANGLNVKLTVGNDEVFNKTTNGFEAEKGKIYVFGTTVISDVDALMDALANGGDVTLTDDVTLTGAVIIAAGKNVTIDLNNNKLITSTTNGTGDDITVKGKLNFINGTIETAQTGLLVDGGELVLGNCTIEGKNPAATAVVALGANAKVEATNCTTNAANCAFYALQGAKMTLTNCTVSKSEVNTIALVAVDGQGSVLEIDGGSYTGLEVTSAYDRYVIGVMNQSSAIINTTVSGGNGGVTVIGASTAELTGGSYSGVKACGLYVAGGSTVTYQNCTFSGVEGDVVVGGGTYGAGTVNGTEYTEYTKVIQQVSTTEELKSVITDGGHAILAPNSNVTLTEAVTIAAGKNVTIDLNNNKLITSTTNGTGDDITVKGKLNFINGTIETAQTGLLVDGGELVLGNCTIEGKNPAATAVVALGANAKVEATNCTTNAANCAFYALQGAKMTLTNCTVSKSEVNTIALVAVDGQGSVLEIDGGSYTGLEVTSAYDRYVIGVMNQSSATINTTVSGGNGGVTVIGASTANLTGGSYSGVKACGLYVDGQSTVTYADDCTFNGVEGYVVVGNQNGGGTVNGTEYTEYTRIQ